MSKNKLWVFGDSFSVPFELMKHIPYIPYKGYVPKIYSEIIANELGYDLMDNSIGGSQKAINVTLPDLGTGASSSARSAPSKRPKPVQNSIQPNYHPCWHRSSGPSTAAIGLPRGSI